MSNQHRDGSRPSAGSPELSSPALCYSPKEHPARDPFLILAPERNSSLILTATTPGFKTVRQEKHGHGPHLCHTASAAAPWLLLKAPSNTQSFTLFFARSPRMALALMDFGQGNPIATEEDKKAAELIFTLEKQSGFILLRQ